MKAAILSIGDELVLGQSVDTNGAWLSARLAELGIFVEEHRTVPDDRPAITAAFEELARGRDVLVSTGGLGPTPDDLTRDGLGEAMDPGRPLVTDPEESRRLERWYAQRHRPMPESNRRQAERPASAESIPNDRGTAPGIAGRLGACRVFVLPGPPWEMKPMFEAMVQPRLEASGLCDPIVTETVRECGLGESTAAEVLDELVARDRDPTVGTTAHGSVVSARIRTRGPRDAVTPAVEATAQEIERRWAPYAFGRGTTTLAEALGRTLLDAGATIATAESCTGGLVGAQIVDVAGSSRYYRGGWVVYSNDLKAACLDVDPALIEQVGAVSEEVAEALANGARGRAGADFAVAVTGIAGPDGGTEIKPVGSVFVGIARPDGDTIVRRFRFRGSREQVRVRTTAITLQLARFAVLGVIDSTRLAFETTATEAS